MHWDYTERRGAQEFRPFDYLGFRYLEVIGAGEPLGRDRRDRRTRATRRSPTSTPRASTSSNADVERGVEPAAPLGALRDAGAVPRHADAREGRVHGSQHVVGDDGRLRRPGHDVPGAPRLRARPAALLARAGRVNAVYPNGDGKRDIPDSTEQFVDWVWQTYETTGDVSQLASLYPVVKNVSDYVARAVDPKTGLVTNLPGGGGDYLYGLVDWPPQMRYGYDMATAARTTENALGGRRVPARGRRWASLLAPPGRGAQGRAGARRRASRRRCRRGCVAPTACASTGSKRTARRASTRRRSRTRTRWRSGSCPPRRCRRSPTTSCSLKNSIGVSTFGYLLTALHGANRDARVRRRAHRPEPARLRAHPPGGRDLRLGELGRAPDRRQRVARVRLQRAHDHAAGPARRDRRPRRAAPGSTCRRRRSRPCACRAWRSPSGAGSRSRGTARRRAGSRSRSRSPTTCSATIHVPAAERRPTSATATSASPTTRQVHGLRVASGEVVLTVGSGHYEIHVPGARAPRRRPGSSRSAGWLAGRWRPRSWSLRRPRSAGSCSAAPPADAARQKLDKRARRDCSL